MRLGSHAQAADHRCDIENGNPLQAADIDRRHGAYLRAHIREQRRNIVVIDATLTDSAGNICTEATCTYFSFPREKAERDMHFVSCKVEGEE